MKVRCNQHGLFRSIPESAATKKESMKRQNTIRGAVFILNLLLFDFSRTPGLVHLVSQHPVRVHDEPEALRVLNSETISYLGMHAPKTTMLVCSPDPVMTILPVSSEMAMVQPTPSWTSLAASSTPWRISFLYMRSRFLMRLGV